MGAGQPSGMSVHIGLNQVDPSAYGGWNGSLAGCINDATDMKTIADGLGYRSVLLTDAQATSSRVVQEIGQAAQQLSAGDIFLLTYSGHGGQVQDVNGDEPDGQDETWVLWDRQLIDDELYSLWSQFRQGVRICMLSDSCHSGTMLRMIAVRKDLSGELMDGTRGKPSEATQTAFRALGDVLQALGTPDALSPSPVRALNGGSRASSVAPAPVNRALPTDVRDFVNRNRSSEIATAQWIAGRSDKAQIGATVILISGCQDYQVSMDGNANGLFTEKLKSVWNGGAFSGDYKSMWTQICAVMPTSQVPNYAIVGAANPTFEQQKPFVIGAQSGGGGNTATTRPSLQRGSTGADVSYLQQRLQASYPSVIVDGVFGFDTEVAVRQFQQANGLNVDGVVGPDTWRKIEGTAPVPPGSNSPAPGTPTPSPNTPPATPTPVPASPGATARATLRRGNSGPDVVYLQQRLAAFGYNIQADGAFGPMTESFVRSFQKGNGLSPDGIVGPATWTALG